MSSWWEIFRKIGGLSGMINIVSCMICLTCVGVLSRMMREHSEQKLIRSEPVVVLNEDHTIKTATKSGGKPENYDVIVSDIDAMLASSKEITEVDQSKNDIFKGVIKKSGDSGNAKTRVQIGAFKSNGEAVAEWLKLKRTYSGLLDGLKYTVSQAKINDSMIYKLQIERGSISAAQSTCDALKHRGIECFITD